MMKRPLGRLPSPLRLFLVQSAIWTLACVAAELVCHRYLHLGYPFNYPAVPRASMFGDFTSYLPKFAFFHSRAFYQTEPGLTYPAPSVVLFKLFLLPQPGTARQMQLALFHYLGVMVLTSVVLLVAFWRGLIRHGLGTRTASWFAFGTSVCSFPVWFDLHQGNIEFVVWITTVCAVWAIWTRRFSLAAIFLGAAIALKLYPVILLGLLLAQKRLREAALALGAASALTLASLWLICPDVRYSWHATNEAISRTRTEYMLTLFPVESGFDHGLFVLLKRSLPTLPPPEHLAHVLRAYLVLSAVAGVTLFFLRIRKLPVINQVLALSIAAVLLPPVSYDYTLLHLYAPFALLAFFAVKNMERQTRALTLAFSLLAIILSAQSEFILHGFRFSGQLKAVALLALFVLSVVCPFRDTAHDDEARALKETGEAA